MHVLDDRQYRELRSTGEAASVKCYTPGPQSPESQTLNPKPQSPKAHTCRVQDPETSYPTELFLKGLIGPLIYNNPH